MNSKLKGLLDYLITIAIVLVLTVLFVTFVGQRTLVNGSSMVPTLEDGDQLMTDKISYRFKDPKRFDIIVFPYSKESKTYYIKRIIGLPGETVRIDAADGTIYIDGEPLEEEYGNSVITYAGTAETEIVLGEDEYFVLGDNRAVSKDSRYEDVGNVHRGDIIGRAFLRIYPFSEIGFPE